MKTLAVAITLTLAAGVHGGEQLIVFTQPDASPLAQAFGGEHLDQLHELASRMRVPLTVVDVSAVGAPGEVRLTPLIMYQNHLGRSVYQGRYTTLNRVKNFVRTARRMPQGDATLKLSDIPVKQVGRARIGTPIKITELAGSQPDGFDGDAFARQMRGAITEALAKRDYATAKQAWFTRSDRLFYIDFYPYRSEAGKLFVSAALFSQFHCHQAVWTTGEQPITGRFDDAGEAFGRTAEALADQINRQLAASKIGDGWDAVSTATPTVTFEKLGLALPPAPEGAARVAAVDVAMPTAWTVDAEAAGGEPMIQFAFAAPLDGYAGEVRQLSGSMNLGDNAALASASGRFAVQAASLTMGEADLDAHIHGSLLRVKDHPTATFEFAKVESNANRLAFGQITPVTLVGRFTLMGRSIDLAVPGQLDAYVGDDGKVRLLFEGAWQLGIKREWGLEGPPGPAASQNTMNFRARIPLVGGG